MTGVFLKIHRPWWPLLRSATSTLASWATASCTACAGWRSSWASSLYAGWAGRWRTAPCWQRAWSSAAPPVSGASSSSATPEVLTCLWKTTPTDTHTHKCRHTQTQKCLFFWAKSFLFHQCRCVEHSRAILGYTLAELSVLCKWYHSAGYHRGKPDPVC